MSSDPRGSQQMRTTLLRCFHRRSCASSPKHEPTPNPEALSSVVHASLLLSTAPACRFPRNVSSILASRRADGDIVFAQIRLLIAIYPVVSAIPFERCPAPPPRIFHPERLQMAAFRSRASFFREISRRRLRDGYCIILQSSDFRARAKQIATAATHVRVEVQKCNGVASFLGLHATTNRQQDSEIVAEPKNRSIHQTTV